MIMPFEALDAPPPKDYSGWTNLQSLADSIKSDTNSPAMAIAMSSGGRLERAVSGKRVLNGSAAVGVDEPWSIGSIGKPICSTIIGRLIESGKLRWNSTLAEVLKSTPMRQEYRGVTLEQLMHHRGGVPADPGMTQSQVLRIVAGVADPSQIRANYARDILSRAPHSRPGARFEYSNAGYALLGVVAETVTRKPYERLVRDMVFSPLSLKHSFTGADRLPNERPSGHARNGGTLRPENLSGPLEILFAPAGGGLWMSAADLVRFGRLHLEGLQGKDGLLRASTIARLHSGEPEESGGGRKYACGWGIETFAGMEPMHTHNGSNGTMRAQLAIFPKSGLVVVSFVNAGGESEPSPPLQAVLAVAKRFPNPGVKATGNGPDRGYCDLNRESARDSAKM